MLLNPIKSNPLFRIATGLVKGLISERLWSRGARVRPLLKLTPEFTDVFMKSWVVSDPKLVSCPEKFAE